MIKGMTGFGSAQMSNDKFSATIEIKSVNHRYLDVNYYLPGGFASIENKLRQIVQKTLARGRVTLSVKIAQKTTQKVSINNETVKAYLSQINQLKKTHKLKGEVSVTDILKLQGVLQVEEVSVNVNKIYSEIEKCVQKALSSLVHMRSREGQSLAKDIGSQLKAMNLSLKKITTKAKSLLAKNKKTLTNEEYSSYQKSSDVNEELARLEHYIAELKKMLASNNPIGKKIDFVGQEMQRETNTIGSKLQEKSISNEVIFLKSKIEKVREQAQNIE